jgi:LmbE family N-acetylglucosaminyl deacetylase
MIALAVGCHPDDIELMMSGTLFLLRRAGWAVHYVNLANGCCGTDSEPVDRIVAARRAEARTAAELLGATWHESLVNDLEVFYDQELIRRVTGLVREVRPTIVFTQSLEDYMEDHVNTARVTVTAAFCRGMVNYRSLPERAPFGADLMVYHATPHTLTDPMRRPIMPELFIDVGTVIEEKRSMLACHKSQATWLDRSQGMASYITAMVDAARAVGGLSGQFGLAEGWRRHSHVGFSAMDGDPLADALASAGVARRALLH